MRLRERVLKFFCVQIAILGLSSTQTQAITIAIPGDTVAVGERFTLDISASLEETTTTTLTVVFQYIPQLMQIVDVTGGANFIMQCSQPSTSLSIESRDVGFLRVTCSDIEPLAGSMLCAIKIRALQGNDSLAQMSVDRVLVDDRDTVGEYEDGIVIIRGGPPIEPIPVESIEQASPNPIRDIGVFHYTLLADSFVRFSVFTINGELVFTEFIESQEGRKRIPYEYAPGVDVANGVYLMRMETMNGVYTIPFQYVR